MGRLYLVSDRQEIDRRRPLVAPGTVLEVWQDLYAAGISWLGDEAARRVAYEQPRAVAPAGLYWIGQAAKDALDRIAEPLPFVLAVPETAVPIYYGPRFADAESLPREESLRARVLSAHGIAVAWATYDESGARRDPAPVSPTDPTFFLRRPRGGTIHVWRLFRTGAAAVAYVSEHHAGDPEARRWAEALPAPDFDTLVQRFGTPD